MTDDQLRELMDLARMRDEKRYAWLRHLLLLAAGALTILVTLQPPGSEDAVALWSLRVAWVGLGLSILLLGVALHGEVWTADAVTTAHAGQLSKRTSRTVTTVVKRPRAYWWSERIAYVALAATVQAMVCYGLALY